jgi:uncharacterized protein DUF3107
VDVRIGVTYTGKEIELELADDADRQRVVSDIEAALGNGGKVLWLTDKRGRSVGVPSDKVAYVEIGGPDDARRVGFGAH